LAERRCRRVSALETGIMGCSADATDRPPTVVRGLANCHCQLEDNPVGNVGHRRRHHGAQRGACPHFRFVVGTGGTDNRYET